MTRHFLTRSAVYLAACLSLACESQPTATYGPDALLIRNVHVVDVVSGGIRENQMMVIDSGRIRGRNEAPTV